MPSARLYLGVFLVCAASLMVEVGLTRVFSFTYWYHFAYLLISVALLGTGAAGSFLSAWPGLGRTRPHVVLPAAALLAAASCLLIIAMVARTTLAPARLLDDVRAWSPLLGLYALLVVPFFATGLIVASLLARFPRQTPRLYCVDLAGAGLGCLLVVQLLWCVGVVQTIVLAGGLFAAGAVVLAWEPHRSRWPVLLGVSAFTVAGAGFWRVDAGALALPPAPDKAMHNLLRGQGGARVEFTRWTPICRVDVIGWADEAHSRELGMWSLWGMSRTYRGPFPPQKYFAQDGDACTSMYRYTGDPTELAFLDASILKTPYLLVDRPRTLMIGLGGATDVHVGIRNGAAHITGVDINPVMVDLIANRYRDWSGGLYQRPDVTIHVAEGRGFVRSHPGTYDLIQLNGVDTLAALSSGAYILSESYLYTIEAMQDLWSRLEPEGILSLVIAEEDLALSGSGPDDLRTPRFTTRLLGVLRGALEREGVTDPARHWLVLTNEQPVLRTRMVNILTTRSPLTPAQIDRYRQFADRMGFRSWYHPGIDVAEAPVARFIGFDAAERARFFARAELDVTPTTDNNPFFFNYYKWGSLLRAPELQRDRPGRSYGEGQLVLLVMLVQALVCSALLIGLPLIRVARPAARAGRTRLAIGVYFAALGLGFVFVEIGLIQQFTLFLGYPTYALSCVLAAMLASSGLGSLLSGRVADRDLARALGQTLAALMVLLAVLLLVYPALLRALLTVPLGVRALLAVGLIAPFGLVMGRFFPLGLRVVEQRVPAYIPWAWAINGCCSVVGTILSVILAISVGFQNLFLIAAAVYAVGTLALRPTPPRQGGVVAAPQ